MFLHHNHQVPLRVLPLEVSGKQDSICPHSVNIAASAEHRAMHSNVAQYGGATENKAQRHFAMPSSLASSTTSTSSSTADLAGDFQGELLPELWQTTSSSSTSLSNIADSLTISPASTVTPNLWQGMAPSPNQRLNRLAFPPNYARDPFDYAQSLLPNTLYSDINIKPTLNALTEENLLHNTEMPTEYNQKYFIEENEELFKFEQQQLQYQQQQGLTHKYHPQNIIHSAPPQLSPSRNYKNPLCSRDICAPETSNDSYASKLNQQNQQQQMVNTQLYKTELCASFMKMGLCPYGNKCQFAHGENELKAVERPPKWRSKPCANWAKHGNCRYGNRCCFKHGDN